MVWDGLMMLDLQGRASSALSRCSSSTSSDQSFQVMFHLARSVTAHAPVLRGNVPSDVIRELPHFISIARVHLRPATLARSERGKPPTGLSS